MKIAQKLAEVGGGERGQRATVLFRKVLELRDVAPVSFQGIERESPFDLEVVEKRLLQKRIVTPKY